MVSRAIESRRFNWHPHSMPQSQNVELDCDMTNMSHHHLPSDISSWIWFHSFILEQGYKGYLSVASLLSWTIHQWQKIMSYLWPTPAPLSGQTAHPSPLQWHADTNTTVWGLSSGAGDSSRDFSGCYSSPDNFYRRGNTRSLYSPPGYSNLFLGSLLGKQEQRGTRGILSK